MAQLTGMADTLVTAQDNEESETDEHLYIGVVGTGGGREFPLFDTDNPEFKPGLNKYALGEIWEGGIIVPGTTRFPNRSNVGKDNDPALAPLDIDKVAFVYIRKQDKHGTYDDNAYRLKQLVVVLYGPVQPSRRIFRFDGESPVWIGNEHGQVIYLAEARVAGLEGVAD